MVGKFTAYGSMVYLHTPLHLASRNGHKAVVELLIKVGSVVPTYFCNLVISKLFFTNYKLKTVNSFKVSRVQPFT